MLVNGHNLCGEEALRMNIFYRNVVSVHLSNRKRYIYMADIFSFILMTIAVISGAVSDM